MIQMWSHGIGASLLSMSLLTQGCVGQGSQSVPPQDVTTIDIGSDGLSVTESGHRQASPRRCSLTKYVPFLERHDAAPKDGYYEESELLGALDFAKRIGDRNQEIVSRAVNAALYSYKAPQRDFFHGLASERCETHALWSLSIRMGSANFFAYPVQRIRNELFMSLQAVFNNPRIDFSRLSIEILVKGADKKYHRFTPLSQNHSTADLLSRRAFAYDGIVRSMIHARFPKGYKPPRKGGEIEMKVVYRYEDEEKIYKSPADFTFQYHNGFLIDPTGPRLPPRGK